MSSGAVVAIAVCVTLTAVTALVMIWYFLGRSHKTKARNIVENESQIAEKDGPERAELCGYSRQHEAPDNVTHEMYVSPHEILGVPIEGPMQPLKLSPGVKYSRASKAPEDILSTRISG